MFCTTRRASNPPPSTPDMLDTMHVLESAAIALGAATLTPQQIRRARELNAAVRAIGQNRGAAAHLAREFHQVLLAGCPNARMLALIHQHSSGSATSDVACTAGSNELSEVADDHDAILDMIMLGMPPRDIERAWRLHARSSTLCSAALCSAAAFSAARSSAALP